MPNQTKHVVETDEARAGMTDGTVRPMLIFGTLGVIALFAIVFLYYFH
ncbi:MAG TPA: hypothetical protein VHV58_08670 [Pseudolabrys sp.]|jgi:hypothetical protein|nr:hypothetical protein [Pseudolabrys sp.]